MFRHGQCLLTFVLTAVYLGQSLFLGALHYHPTGDRECVHDNHEHAGHSHPHLHPAAACSSCEQHSATVQDSRVLAGFEPRSVGDSHADCAVCQYLSQGAIACQFADDIISQQITALSSNLKSSFVSLRPYSLPRPRSPPSDDILFVG